MREFDICAAYHRAPSPLQSSDALDATSLQVYAFNEVTFCPPGAVSDELDFYREYAAENKTTEGALQAWNDLEELKIEAGSTAQKDRMIDTMVVSLASSLFENPTQYMNMPDALWIRNHDVWSPAVWITTMAVAHFKPKNHSLTAVWIHDIQSGYLAESHVTGKRYHTFIIVHHTMTTISVIDKKNKKLFILGDRVPMDETYTRHLELHTHED